MTETLSIRIPAPTRQRIEEAAKRNNRSLSQEVVRRLEDTFVGSSRVQALARMVVEIANTTELTAEKSWLDDSFTAKAVVRAIEAFVWQVASEGPETVPGPLEETAKRLEKLYPAEGDVADQYRSTWGVGRSITQGALFRLLTSDASADAELREALGLKRGSEMVNVLADFKRGRGKRNG
jgi:hypothetical protein